jgi:hypothetical protein
MKHWSYITNPSPNCRRYLLRTNRHAWFTRSTWPNMMTPTKCRPYQANEGKTGAVLKPMRPTNRWGRSGQKHPHWANPHSNKRSNKTNPAISRLSASRTQGNDPRHPHAAPSVRETYTKAAVRCIMCERPLPIVNLDILPDSETMFGVAGQGFPEVQALCGLDRSGAARRCRFGVL